MDHQYRRSILLTMRIRRTAEMAIEVVVGEEMLAEMVAENRCVKVGDERTGGRQFPGIRAEEIPSQAGKANESQVVTIEADPRRVTMGFLHQMATTTGHLLHDVAMMAE